MSRPVLTRELAFAASLDAANRAMWAAGRTEWSIEDQTVASQCFDQLWPRCPHLINPEDFCHLCDQESLPVGHPLSNKLGPLPAPRAHP
jgi:hypothetical protein